MEVPLDVPAPALAELSYRLTARLIDQSLVGVAAVGAVGAGIAAGIALPELRRWLPDLLTELVFACAVALLIGVQWFTLASDGTTVGKRSVGIRVVGEDGAPVGFLRAVVIRSFVPGLAGSVTLGLFAVVDLLPIFAGDRRCVHDRLALTQVVLDPRQSEVEAHSPHPIAVRHGLRFAHRLALALFAVAVACAAIVAQNVLGGLATTAVGGLATLGFAGLGAALAVSAAIAYDCRPAGIGAGAALAGTATAAAGAWMGCLLWLGGASVLPWLLGAGAGYVAIVAGLFVGPSVRIAAERRAHDEQAMLAELGLAG
ncbi:MAG: RDD family protein [Myxococcota bacterium]